MTLTENNLKIKLYKSDGTVKELFTTYNESIMEYDAETSMWKQFSDFIILTDTTSIEDVREYFDSFKDNITKIEGYVKLYDDASSAFTYTLNYTNTAPTGKTFSLQYIMNRYQYMKYNDIKEYYVRYGAFFEANDE